MSKVISLTSVYDNQDSPRVLYELLKERTPEMNISFRMPTEAQHMQFFCSKPYEHWYLIVVDGAVVGNVYLTKLREVGIFIFTTHQRNGYGRSAVEQLKALHPGKLLANINPKNERSKALFKGLGFKHIQETYELEAYEQT